MRRRPEVPAAAADAHTPAVERVLTAASGPAPGYELGEAYDEHPRATRQLVAARGDQRLPGLVRELAEGFV